MRNRRHRQPGQTPRRGYILRKTRRRTVAAPPDPVKRRPLQRGSDILINHGRPQDPNRLQRWPESLPASRAGLQVSRIRVPAPARPAWMSRRPDYRRARTNRDQPLRPGPRLRHLPHSHRIDETGALPGVSALLLLGPLASGEAHSFLPGAHPSRRLQKAGSVARRSSIVRSSFFLYIRSVNSPDTNPGLPCNRYPGRLAGIMITKRDRLCRSRKIFGSCRNRWVSCHVGSVFPETSGA